MPWILDTGILWILLTPLLFCSCHTWELRDEEEGEKEIPSQLCHVCGIVAALSSFEPISPSPSFPISTGSPWQLGGSFPSCCLISPQVQTKSGASWGGLLQGHEAVGDVCHPIPFVPHPCLFLGGLTAWHEGSGRGLILPGRPRSVSWVGETWRRRQYRAAAGSLSLCGTVGALGRSGRAAFQAAHTHWWLLPTLARFPGCLKATLCFLSGYLQV